MHSLPRAHSLRFGKNYPKPPSPAASLVKRNLHKVKGYVISRWKSTVRRGVTHQNQLAKQQFYIPKPTAQTENPTKIPAHATSFHPPPSFLHLAVPPATLNWAHLRIPIPPPQLQPLRPSLPRIKRCRLPRIILRIQHVLAYAFIISNRA